MNRDDPMVVLAAGMGSRFGGLKQMEPMDGHGNFIIDYSIYDPDFDRIYQQRLLSKSGCNEIIY